MGTWTLPSWVLWRPLWGPMVCMALDLGRYQDQLLRVQGGCPDFLLHLQNGENPGNQSLCGRVFLQRSLVIRGQTACIVVGSLSWAVLRPQGLPGGCIRV